MNLCLRVTENFVALLDREVERRRKTAIERPSRSALVREIVKQHFETAQAVQPVAPAPKGT